MSEQSAVAVPEKTDDADKQQRRDERRKRQPGEHVRLGDRDDHGYDYDVERVQKLFGHPKEQGFIIAKAVDTTGRATCLTTTKEHAELKRDQIHAYGADPLSVRCKGSMKASIEPEE